MTLHHDTHHQAYVNGLNAALDKLATARATGEFGLVKHLEREVAFHGGGHILHSIFWTSIAPGGGGEPDGTLADALTREFGSFAAFDAQIRAAANAVEGSGWGVLAMAPGRDQLAVLQVEKHQNLPLPGWVPILAIDVWEHAYYLRYQNRRAEWVEAMMTHLVNWPDVARRYGQATRVSGVGPRAAACLGAPTGVVGR